MKIKKNYFLRNMVDLDIHSLAEYLSNADFNYVILEKNIPLVWASDNSPVVYGGEMDVINELMELDAFADVEKCILKPEFKVITEQEFIETFCLDEIINYINKQTLCNGEFDGVNMIVYTDNTFNKIIEIDGYTDIIGIFANMNGKETTALITCENDTKQSFVNIGELPFEVIIKIVELVEK